MKKTPAILLLLVILYQIVGYYSFHQLQVYQIKKEIKRKLKKSIPKEELVVISFALSESNKIHWIEKDKEFIFEKKMFDVVETKRTVDSINFYCIHDFKETEIFARLDDYINNYISTNPDHQKKANQLYKRFNPDYFFPRNIISTFDKTKKNKKNSFFLVKNYLFFQMVDNPPPKIS